MKQAAFAHGRSRLKRFLCSPDSRSCYWATGIFGILSYLYLFVNNISNNDMIACLPQGYGTGISSGRWLLHLLGALTDRVWGAYNVPLFNGLLALILLALTSALLVRLLGLKSKRLCFCVAAVTASAAPIASTMFFQFTVHYFALALFMTVAAAYLLRRSGLLAFLGAAVLAACSLGIYQAYFPFFAVLLLLSLLASCLDRSLPVKGILWQALRSLGVLILSYLLYRLALLVCLRALGEQLSDYQGIGSMGSFSLKNIPVAYLEFFLLPVREFAGFNATVFLRAVLLCLMLLSLVMLVCFLRRNRSHLLLALLSLLLIPLASHAFLILTPDSTIYTRMCMGLMSVFYLPAVLAQHLQTDKLQIKRALQGAICLLLILSALNYGWQSNGNYQYVYYSNRKAENYFATLYTRAKSLDGYRADMEVVLVGETFSDESYQDNWLTTPFLYRGRTGAVAQLNQYSRAQFVANYLGYSLRSATDEETARYAQIIAQMPCYPDSSSLQIADDLILIRLE